ncbi:MAG: polysaccharide deacetylase family protein [Christensenellaceae bacterium]|nr:polysaccharide deacetylase family protein [Christensenellaceae bacterium]
MPYLLFPQGRKKALTLSYDDGVEQDARLIQILDRHGLRATFNLNSGCFPQEGVTYPAGTIHRRMPLSWCQKTYSTSRHEVAVHCLTHAMLTELPQPQVLHEILRDRENLEAEFGGMVRGFAYPFGAFNDRIVDALQASGIAYARTVYSTHGFDIPQDWLRLHPTCHHNDPQLDALCDRFLNEPARFSSQLFYLWGHAYEFEEQDNWQVIERFAERMGGHDDIWYATNIEIVDYVNAYRQLMYSADGNTIYNPNHRTIWLEMNGKALQLEAGETLRV